MARAYRPRAVAALPPRARVGRAAGGLPRSVGADGGRARRGALAVVLGEVAGEADGADELAARQEWQAALEGHGSLQAEDAQAEAALGHRVLEDLGGTL